jgi:peroxiredoxin
MSAARWFLVCFLTLLAQICWAEQVEAGHSRHGEAFNEGPRQSAVLMQGTGAVSFPISTKNPTAQAFFNQGIGQLHGFWYFEAERSFRQASKLDPDAAMPFWGMAMANINNEKRARGFIQRAMEKKDGASKRERQWMVLLEKYYSEAKDDKRDKKQRELDYIAGLEDIIHDHPDDLEAKAFLAWKIWDARDEVAISSHEAVESLLQRVFDQDRDHPAHHYRIHLWDNKKPARALESAAACGPAADGIAHMWHMPGHTYSKLGRHDDAAWQQEAATRVDHAYMQRALVLPDQIHNYAHNEEWLVRTYNELGRVGDAKALARSLLANPRHPKFNHLDKGSTSASYGRTRLLETLVKWELWDELLKVTGGPLFPQVTQEGHEVSKWRAVGIAHFYQGNPRGIKDAMAKIESARKAAAALPVKEEVRKALPATAAKVPQKKEKKASDTDKALETLRVLLKVSSKDPGAALAVSGAKALPSELVVESWLRLGDKAKASESAKKLPQDLAGRIRQALTFYHCGRAEDAKKALKSVRERSYAMDGDLPVVARLESMVAALGLKDGWRGETLLRKDIGPRPALSSLGPVHYTPPLAPSWKAQNAKGEWVSNKDYSGKPLVLVFYIGGSCAHCMEQLNAVESALAEFQKRKLPVVALSPEPLSQVGKAHRFSKTKGGFPFPLLAAEQEVFRAYRAWDDFEDVSLHAVALVDGQGKLRWLDVSYEPFMDAKFVAQEAERLLGL